VSIGLIDAAEGPQVEISITLHSGERRALLASAELFGLRVVDGRAVYETPDGGCN